MDTFVLANSITKTTHIKTTLKELRNEFGFLYTKDFNDHVRHILDLNGSDGKNISTQLYLTIERSVEDWRRKLEKEMMKKSQLNGVKDKQQLGDMPIPLEKPDKVLFVQYILDNNIIAYKDLLIKIIRYKPDFFDYYKGKVYVRSEKYEEMMEYADTLSSRIQMHIAEKMQSGLIISGSL